MPALCGSIRRRPWRFPREGRFNRGRLPGAVRTAGL
jgi:hypothetical protein